MNIFDVTFSPQEKNIAVRGYFIDKNSPILKRIERVVETKPYTVLGDNDTPEQIMVEEVVEKEVEYQEPTLLETTFKRGTFGELTEEERYKKCEEALREYYKATNATV